MFQTFLYIDPLIPYGYRLSQAIHIDMYTTLSVVRGGRHVWHTIQDITTVKAGKASSLSNIVCSVRNTTDVCGRLSAPV